MQISINDLWEELDLDGKQTLEEYVNKKIDNQIIKINEKVDVAIKLRIIGAIESMRKDIESSKSFAKCADAKINKHLLEHEQIPQELEVVKEKDNA